jgi:hypothetical protein
MGRERKRNSLLAEPFICPWSRIDLLRYVDMKLYGELYRPRFLEFMSTCLEPGAVWKEIILG